MAEVSFNEAINFSRASTGTYWGPDGKLHTAAVDEARIQHDPVSGEALGLLIESSSTNNSPSNHDLASGLDYVGAFGFENTTRLNISTTDIGIPGVSLTADNDGAVGAADSSSFVPVNENYALSAYVKPKTASAVRLDTSRTGSGNAVVRVVLDVSTEEVTVNTGGVSGAAGGAKNVGGGWWRLWVVRPSIASGSGTQHISVYATGLLAGEDIEVAGVNAEIGLAPTSYIPTSGSPVTRAADNAVIDLSDVFNPDEGTFFFVFKAYVGGGEHQYVNFNNAFRLYENTATANRVEFNWGEGVVRTVRPNAPSGYYSFKIALTYTGQQAQLVVRLGDDVSVFSTETDFRIDKTLYLFNRPRGDRAADGIFKTVEYYPESVSEEELNQMVGGDS